MRAVLETIPAVMDRIRGEVRCNAAGALSIPQFRCLHFVSRHPGASLCTLAHHNGIATPTASAIVDRLVREGFLERTTAPEERRRIALRLSPQGQAALDRALAVSEAQLMPAFAALAPDDLAALARGLDALRAVFGIKDP